MIKSKIALLAFSILQITYGAMADTWVPCAKDREFSWKKTTDDISDNERLITWSGSFTNPQRQWKIISENYRGPVTTDEVVRPKITASDSLVGPYSTPHTDDWLFCAYTTDDPNAVVFTGSTLNLTALGHTNCVAVHDPAKGWGAKCD